ncbi:LETM1 domain-containing protein 1 [Colius striatus]|uniref:LETM1 domain-containing protein 1 n=1 Tax=Colius striatus TaxID=57412 RepID=UPI002B1E10F7|nr:LETM1 domain-containing protein 1 [Colius striatus]
MALALAGPRGPLWRLGTGPAAALSLCRGLLEPQPARGAPRSLSMKTSSRAVLAALAAAAKRLSGRYERFLARTCPRFHLLYSAFSGGVRDFILEVKEIRKIRSHMSRQGLSARQLPYREMERLRQFRRDVLKAVPIGLIAIPPFANFLVIVLMYFFPRQFLTRHFWTGEQRERFLAADAAARRASYGHVLGALAAATHSLHGHQQQQRLQDLCQEVQRGRQPCVAELCALRSLFSGSPLGLNHLRGSHLKALSRILFLTPHLPGL